MLPSTKDLIFILLAISLTYGALAPRLLADADIGWHIRDGQQILATQAIPHSDSFSATMSGRPWYAWEWLYDVMIGVIHEHTGLNGVVLFNALIIALALSLTFAFALRRGGPLPTTILLLLACIVSSSIHFLARPHVISWLFSLVWFGMLDRTERPLAPNRRLLCLPFLMLAWVNLHGGFVMGFVLIGIFLLATMARWLSRNEVEMRAGLARRAKNLGLVLLASALASMVNPYGYQLHRHIYQYLTNRFLMQHIEEFRTVNFHSLPAQSFLLLLVLALGGIAWARGRLPLVEWLLIFFSGSFGLYAARNIPLASMLLTILIAPLFSAGTQSRGLGNSPRLLSVISSHMYRIESTLAGHLWPVALVIFSTAICANHGRIAEHPLMEAHFSERRFPVAAVSVLEKRGNRQPIFSQDSWGGYLIYRLYPEAKVFIDDRHDFYGERVLRDYLKVIHVETGWDKVLGTQGVNLILVPRKSDLATALRNNTDWKPSYEDETAVLFERTREQSSRLG